MLIEKPIVYAMGDRGNPVEKSECGICCQAENIKEIAFSMDKLASMKKYEIDKMGKKGREWLMRNQTIQIQLQLILKKLYL